MSELQALTLTREQKVDDCVKSKYNKKKETNELYEFMPDLVASDAITDRKVCETEIKGGRRKSKKSRTSKKSRKSRRRRHN